MYIDIYYYTAVQSKIISSPMTSSIKDKFTYYLFLFFFPADFRKLIAIYFSSLRISAYLLVKHIPGIVLVQHLNIFSSIRHDVLDW